MSDTDPHDGVRVLAMIFTVLIFVALYLAPMIVALCRKHRQAGAIAALNILLGWSVLGWIGALIWSLTSPAPAPTVIIHNNTGAGQPGN